MRKFLITLMMLVMLTPSLACAMPVCVGHAATKAASMPCADHADNDGYQKSDADQKLNLLKDCMGIDLQVADSVSVDKPDIHASVFAFVLNSDFSVTGFGEKADVIRGPPPGWPVAQSTQPSLILSTQRFRI